MQQQQQQHFNSHRQPQSSSYIPRPSASSASTVADHRNPGYGQVHPRPQASLPTPPLSATALGSRQLGTQRFDAQYMNSQPPSPMSPAGNQSGSLVSRQEIPNAPANSYVPQHASNQPAPSIQSIQAQHQQLRIQTQLTNQYSPTSVPQNYQEQQRVIWAQQLHALSPQYLSLQPQGWSYPTQTSPHTQVPATRRHTVDVPPHANQHSYYAANANGGGYPAVSQQRYLQTSHSVPVQMTTATNVHTGAPAAASPETATRLAPTPAQQAQPQSLSGPAVSTTPTQQQQTGAQQPSASGSGSSHKQQPPPGSTQPSTSATAHAATLLQRSGRYLEAAYLCAQMTIAAELDRLSADFVALQKDKTRLQQLLEQRDAERVRLQQKVTEMEENNKTAARERDGVLAQFNKLKGVFSDMKKYIQAQAEKANEAAGEMKKMREVNVMLARLLRKTGQVPPDTLGGLVNQEVPDSDEIKLVQIGPYSVPEALGEALNSSIAKSLSDEFEQRLAEMMVTQVTERTKLTKENALLKAAFASQGRTIPSSIAFSPVPAAASPAVSNPPARPAHSIGSPVTLSPFMSLGMKQPFVSPLTPPAEPAAASTSRPRSLSVTASLTSTLPGQSPAAALEPSAPEPAQATSLPTPTYTVSPRRSSSPSGELFPCVKQEEAPARFPWAQGDVIDLTMLLDSPPVARKSLAPLELNIESLEQRLAEMHELVGIEGPAAEEAHRVVASQAAEPQPMDVSPSADAFPDTDTADETGKKRVAEEAELEVNGDAARKKQRVEGSQDVEMGEATKDPELVKSLDEPVVPMSSPEVLAASIMDVDVSANGQNTNPLASTSDLSARAEDNVTSNHTERLESPEDSGAFLATADDASSAHGVDTMCLPSTSSISDALSILSLPSLDAPSKSTKSSEANLVSPSPTTSSYLQTAPPQLGNGTHIEVRVKQELDDSAYASIPAPPESETSQGAKLVKFSLRHLDLAYNKNGERMTCRMCISRKQADPTWKVAVFPQDASWDVFSGHCERVHPKGFKSLVGLSAAKAAEMRERISKN